MKISVITVCFNAIDTIKDCLLSVKAQTRCDIEHIIIDGYSTDGTLKFLSDWQKQHSYVSLTSEPDNGLYDAMNKGLKNATGDIIAFLNADDFYASNDVIRQVLDLFKNKKLDILYGDLEYIDFKNNDKIVRSWQPGDFSSSKLRKAWIPPHPSFFFKRTLLKEVPSFNLAYTISADYDFMLRCLLVPKVRVKYLPTTIVKMRTGGASNNSLKILVKKINEDASLLKANKQGGYFTSIYKRLSKLNQWL